MPNNDHGIPLAVCSKGAACQDTVATVFLFFHVHCYIVIPRSIHKGSLACHCSLLWAVGARLLVNVLSIEIEATTVQVVRHSIDVSKLAIETAVKMLY